MGNYTGGACPVEELTRDSSHDAYLHTGGHRPKDPLLGNCHSILG